MNTRPIFKVDGFSSCVPIADNRGKRPRRWLDALDRIMSRRRPVLNIENGFEILPGNIYAVVGESGAGKTVLNSFFMGCPAFSVCKTNATCNFFGTVVCGRELSSRRLIEKAWNRIRRRGVLLYLPQLLPDGRGFEMRVKEYYVQIVCALLKQCRVQVCNADILKVFEDDRERLYRIASPLRSKLEHTVNQLSGGERRRIELIARVFALSVLPGKRQALLVLDEPTTGLDVPGVREYLTTLRECFDNDVNGNVAIIVTTHALHLLSDDKVFNSVILVRKPDYDDTNGVQCFVSRPLKLDALNKGWIDKQFHDNPNRWAAFLKHQSQLSENAFAVDRQRNLGD